jgi:predicted amidohydrolase YtcJ
MFKYLGIGEDVMGTDPLYVDTMRYAAERRLSVETHVGNIDAILNGFEAADEVYDVGELKWRIAHPGNGQPSDAQLARAKALGVGWALTIGPVRTGGTGPRFKTTMENSERMCLMTDAMNVSPWAPFQTLWYVTSGQTLIPGTTGVPAEERLTRLEALRHATVECGWFLDLDGKVGTLEPGKYADMIVLDKDYFAVPDEEIKDITSLLTVVDGRIVHAAGEYAGLGG